MSDTPIKLQVGGVESQDGYLRLGIFVQQLQFVSALLKEIDLAVSRKKTTYYRVINLNLSSPAEVWLEPVQMYKKIDNRHIIVKRFFEELNSIKNEATISSDISRNFLESLKAIAGPLDKEIGSLNIKADQYSIDIDKPFRANVEVLLAPEVKSYGSVEGVLEAINLHNKNEFRIYPIVGAKVVICNFPKNKREKAKEGLEKLVSVTGLITYRNKENFPHKIDVEDIIVYRPESELPHFYDLRGAAPNATNGLSSEDFVRKLRDEWQ
jgi:hypothetical protein